MSLKKIDVPPVSGRVRFVVEGGSQKTVTVECPIPQKAYWFAVPMDIEIFPGDWVKISGHTKLEVLSKKGEMERLEHATYYHVPHDGTDKAAWTFYELRDAVWDVLGPANVGSVVERLVPRLQRHLADWSANSSREAVQETLELMTELEANLRAHASRPRPEEVKLAAPPLDITVD